MQIFIYSDRMKRMYKVKKKQKGKKTLTGDKYRSRVESHETFPIPKIDNMPE